MKEIDLFSGYGLITAVASLIAALVALWIAWDSRRKTTQHVIMIKRVSSGHKQSRTHPNAYSSFDLLIANLGLPIPKMSVVLNFYEDKLGYLSFPLRALEMQTEKSTDSHDHVATGLIVRFGLRSFEMDKGSQESLSRLVDFRKQRATLSIYCAGYRVTAIRLGSRQERILMRLRNIIFSIASWRWLRLGYYAKNQDSWRARIRLPDSQLLSPALMFFLHNLRCGKPPLISQDCNPGTSMKRQRIESSVPN